MSAEQNISAVATAPRAPAIDRVGKSLGPGSRLGRYTILAAIGSGGMGTVYRAHDAELDRKIALKVLRYGGGEGSATQAARQRLLREARAMAKLTHPNVIRVYDVGTTSSSSARSDTGDESGAEAVEPARRDIDFVAMELVEGCNLAEWLAGKARSWREVVQVFQAAGAGLAAAHGAGLVHRDFKPANVLIGNDGRVLVTDFGLARGPGATLIAGTAENGAASAGDCALDVTLHPHQVGLTATGVVLGTPAYMAPEQHMGTAVDPRADQFGYCVSLYQGLYGARPFCGDSLEELRDSIVSDEPPAFPSRPRVPRALRRIITRGLRVEPTDRFASMNELLSALRRATGLRRRWIAAGILAAAAISILVVGGAIGGAIERDRLGAGDECKTGAQRFGTLWNRDTAATMGRAFASSGNMSADSAIAVVSKRLDEYRDTWLSAHAKVCEARGAKEGAPELYARLGCLLDQRNHFASVVEVLLSADATAVDHAVQAVQGLGDPASCRAVAASPMAPAMPETLHARKEVADLRVDLAKVDALCDAGTPNRGTAQAEAALAKAQALGHRPVQAEALLKLGRALLAIGDFSRARATLDDSLRLAEEIHHTEVAAWASVALTELELKIDAASPMTRGVGSDWAGDAQSVVSSNVVGDGLHEQSSAERVSNPAALPSLDETGRHLARRLSWLRARDAVSRFRNDPSLEARLAMLSAKISAKAEAHEEALAELESAVATYRVAGKDLQAAEVMSEIAEAYRAQRDLERALHMAKEAEKSLVAELGPYHPRVIRATKRTAKLLRATGDLEGARAREARARELRRERRARKRHRAVSP